MQCSTGVWPLRRSALAPEAPAALSAAGAALAVAFLRTGLAVEDAAMLGHLMRLLCRPLADWSTPLPVSPSCQSVCNEHSCIGV